MFTFFGPKRRYCDGIRRRDFLAAGTLALGGLTLSGVLRSRARAGAAARPKSAIMIFLSGGPSHIDSYDMKPDLPDDIRGEFKPIATRVPGLQICELMPLQAKIADKLAVLRGVQTVGNHTGNEFFSGFTFEQGNAGSKGTQRPALGSIVSRVRGGGSALPAYVSLHDNPSWELPYYIGAAHKPFRVFQRQKENLALANLQRSAQVPIRKLQDRAALLRSFDSLRKDVDSSGVLDGLDAMNAKALDILTSDRVRDAFDLSKEPDRLKERYGTKPAAFEFIPGLEFLQARRLVEAGVAVVTVAVHGWDTHQDNFKVLRKQLPIIDQALHALITDLEDRGLLDDVVILMGGEMGRTPKITKDRAGREHWPQTGISVLAGGGLKTGQVVGASDRRG
ncbi:hypothetical protein AYO40_05475, partial [Planctomycetaceae bacterium SCGC AG-212-D15]